MICSLAVTLQPWLGKLGNFLGAVSANLDGPGLMMVALADSSFLSLPEGNDILIVILSTGKSWTHMAYYVGLTVIGSIAGCILLYTVGRKGGSPLLQRKFSQKNIVRAERLFEKYGMLTVALPSILPPPCPFKIFVLSAGVFRLKLSDFVLAIVIGRTIRYSMWGILGMLYGSTVKVYMQRNLPKVGLALFVALLGAIMIMLHSYLRRSRSEKSTAASRT